MWRRYDLFFEFQMTIFNFFGIVITREDLIALKNVAINEILSLKYWNYEKQQELIKIISEMIDAILENDLEKYNKVRKKEYLNLLKDVVDISNLKQEEKQILSKIIERNKNIFRY